MRGTTERGRKRDTFTKTKRNGVTWEDFEGDKRQSVDPSYIVGL